MKAVWQDEKRRFREGGLAWFGSLGRILGSAWCVEFPLLTTTFHCPYLQGIRNRVF